MGSPSSMLQYLGWDSLEESRLRSRATISRSIGTPKTYNGILVKSVVIAASQQVLSHLDARVVAAVGRGPWCRRQMIDQGGRELTSVPDILPSSGH